MQNKTRASLLTYGFIIDQMLKILVLDDFGLMWKFLFDRVLCGMTSVIYREYQIGCLVLNNIGRILVKFRILAKRKK